jgi:hypothetical protein
LERKVTDMLRKKIMDFLKRWMGRPLMTDEEVCEYSRERGLVDYHDYPDDIDGVPCHMVELECKRCGKRFTTARGGWRGHREWTATTQESLRTTSREQNTSGFGIVAGN